MQPPVIVGDSSPIIVEGLRSLLGLEHRLLLGVNRFSDLVELVREHRPKLVILDPYGLGVGIAEVSRIATNSDSKWVLLLQECTGPESASALKFGFAGVVSKTSDRDSIIARLRSIVAGIGLGDSQPEGLTAATPALAEIATAGFQQVPPKLLSARQLKVLRLVALGKSSKEIAWELGVATKTVDFHRAHIISRLGLRTVADWTRYAIFHQILDTAPGLRDSDAGEK